MCVLGKRLGFVPTPSLDVEGTRLDMRLTTNRMLKSAYKSLNRDEQYNTPNPHQIPPKVYQKSYYSAQLQDDNNVNDIVKSMETEHDQKLIVRKISKENRKKNLRKEEWEGLRWLTGMNNEGKLTVVQADKGGAIIVVNPDTLRKKTLEKLENLNLYEKLEEDMTRNLHHELYLKWVEGKEIQLIHPTIARNIMGVSDNDSTKEVKDKTNAKCTSSHFKPGKSYFYPSLKIHKLTRKDLIPGVEPPLD